MTDEQFWSLTPTTFWWNYEARKPLKRYGSLYESDVIDILETMKEAED